MLYTRLEQWRMLVKRSIGICLYGLTNG